MVHISELLLVQRLLSGMTVSVTQNFLDYDWGKLLASEHGCHVFMGSRSVERGNAAVADLLEECPASQGRIDVVQLDTQDSSSVTSAAGTVQGKLGAHILTLFPVIHLLLCLLSGQPRLFISTLFYGDPVPVAHLRTGLASTFRRYLW